MVNTLKWTSFNCLLESFFYKFENIWKVHEENLRTIYCEAFAIMRLHPFKQELFLFNVGSKFYVAISNVYWNSYEKNIVLSGCFFYLLVTSTRLQMRVYLKNFHVCVPLAITLILGFMIPSHCSKCLSVSKTCNPWGIGFYLNHCTKIKGNLHMPHIKIQDLWNFNITSPRERQWRFCLQLWIPVRTVGLQGIYIPKLFEYIYSYRLERMK